MLIWFPSYRSRRADRMVSWLTPKSAARERRLLVAARARMSDSSTGVSLLGRRAYRSPAPHATRSRRTRTSGTAIRRGAKSSSTRPRPPSLPPRFLNRRRRRDCPGRHCCVVGGGGRPQDPGLKPPTHRAEPDEALPGLRTATPILTVLIGALSPPPSGTYSRRCAPRTACGSCRRCARGTPTRAPPGPRA